MLVGAFRRVSPNLDRRLGIPTQTADGKPRTESPHPCTFLGHCRTVLVSHCPNVYRWSTGQVCLGGRSPADLSGPRRTSEDLGRPGTSLIPWKDSWQTDAAPCATAGHSVILSRALSVRAGVCCVVKTRIPTGRDRGPEPCKRDPTDGQAGPLPVLAAGLFLAAQVYGTGHHQVLPHVHDVPQRGPIASLPSL
jgi:hypothetical protein